MVFNTNYRFMQGTSIAECSKGSIMQYFRPSLSYIFPLRPLFLYILSGRLRQVLLYKVVTYFNRSLLSKYPQAMKSAALPEPLSTNTGMSCCIDCHIVFMVFTPPSTTNITTGTFTPAIGNCILDHRQPLFNLSLCIIGNFLKLMKLFADIFQYEL